ncbi:DUF488 domain-containing protein [Rhizobium leguminosarum]|uniref:DUF488 domain-containing protein n=1 Tax=Rhizobium leguminosarum TaxID=384 RepID=UPI00103274EE|nr:DUF488 domain-containing protein [Rhizobium leguminosarum]TAZ00096.1 DUF488 domain-containing protein [Rhizobium leguminosarum]TAZ10963.1 DUF488 domain-containing protein [Rhizobium leguminosarum]
MKTIFTIGYESTDIERFVKTLVAVGIDAIADVRAVPLSRKRGFSKNTLRERLAEVGIQYLPMQALGDPKPGREAAKAGDYETFRSVYGAHIDRPDVSLIVAELVEEARKMKVCLLCFERDPKTCHRMIVGERMEPYGYSMMHLYGDDPQRYVRNKDRLSAAAA